MREAKDRYFAVEVVDPYRWMENIKDPDFGPWLRSQEDYAKAFLRRTPGRAELRNEMGLMRSAEGLEWVTFRGGRYFYLKRKPGEEVASLYFRVAGSESERVVVDPIRLGGETLHTVYYYSPSWDGRYVAFGTTAGGSEDVTVRIAEVDTGRVLPEAIDRCRMAWSLAWHPTNRSFFYLRINDPPPGQPPSELLKRPRIYHHLLGTNPDRDRAVFGHGLQAEVAVGETEAPQPVYSPGSPGLLFVSSSEGVRNESNIFVAPLASLDGPHPAWHRLVHSRDGVTGFDTRGDDLFLLTHRGAARFQILRTRVSSPDFSTATTFVPEGNGVIRAFGVAKDALYVRDLQGSVSRLRRFPFDGGPPTPLALPFEGKATIGSIDAGVEGLLASVQGWIQPPRLYRLDVTKARWTELHLSSPPRIDVSNLQSIETTVPSVDGVRVPLSIVYRTGIPRNGSHPTLLVGYGAYGVVLEPLFEHWSTPRHLAWLRHGGVLAFAHPRGGGEYGEDWHKAGMKEKKLNTVRDMIACAEYLVREGFTRPEKLALHGMSAGGLLVARTITERPDLFAAAVIRMGVTNPLRFEDTPLGPLNTPEYGSVKVEREFRALYAMDGYHHVRPGIRYPAVLFTAGRNDPRIPIWQMTKMLARLQRHSTSGRPVVLRIYDAQGHGISAAESRTDEEMVDTFAFLFGQLRK